MSRSRLAAHWLVLRRGWYAAGATCVPVTGRVQRTSDHLGGGLYHHAASVDLALEEVKKRRELAGADRVRPAVTAGGLVADSVEHELYPIGGLRVGLGVQHVRLECGELGRFLWVGRGAGRIGIGGRDGLAERAGLCDAGHAPAAVVPAVVD